MNDILISSANYNYEKMIQASYDELSQDTQFLEQH